MLSNWLLRQLLRVNVAQSIGTLLAPLFSAADGYLGITIILSYALFWFVGIHGPSIVEPAIAAITYSNVELNAHLIHAGQHADKVITLRNSDVYCNYGWYWCNISCSFHVHMVM